MNIKTWCKIGKTLNYALLIVGVALIVKLVGTLYYGYFYMPIDKASAVFFYWANAYFIKDLKLTYNSNFGNEEVTTDNCFKMYIDNVQDETNPDKSKKAETSESSKKPKNVLGAYPLYQDEKFVDGFMAKPKSTYKIFMNDESKLKLEIDFLAFRLLCLKFLQSETDVDKWEILSKENVKKLFKGKAIYVLEPTTDSTNISTVTFINAKNSKANYDIINDHEASHKAYISIYDDFMKIIESMKKEEPIFNINDQKHVVVDENVMTYIKNICNKLNLTELIVGGGDSPAEEKDKLFEESINSFVERIVTVKLTLLDAHILNRIFYYFYFTHSYLGSEETLKKSKDYSKMKNKLSELRMTMIFNYFAEIIAKNFGNMPGKFLKPEDVGILMKFFFPKFYVDNEKNRELYDVTTIFEEELRGQSENSNGDDSSVSSDSDNTDPAPQSPTQSANQTAIPV